MRIRQCNLFRMLALITPVALWSGGAAAAASCTVSATGPAFGVYDPFNTTARTANGTVQAVCNYTGGPGVTTISMVARYSTGFSGNYANRYMLSGTNRLSYNIYFDPAFTRIRGDGTGGSFAATATLRVSASNRTDSESGTIYGRIPAGQDALPGAYADTITLTVTY
jgi:spore coat protein U-like protein